MINREGREGTRCLKMDKVLGERISHRQGTIMFVISIFLHEAVSCATSEVNRWQNEVINDDAFYSLYYRS